jgi:uncharacterized protein YjbI with pentapeptide repeats
MAAPIRASSGTTSTDRDGSRVTKRQLLAASGIACLGGSAALVTWALGGDLPAAGAAAFLTALIATGAYLWLSSSDRAKTKGDLGRGLLISGVIGIAFAWVQFEVNAYQRDSDEKRAAIAERAASRESLQLTVGLQRNLTGIDLSGRDIAGFYFHGKILRDARLVGARGDQANFASVDLTSADLTRGRFRKANFSQAKMGRVLLTGADFRGAEFFVEGLEQATRVFGQITGDSVAKMDEDLRSAGTRIDSAFGGRADFQDAFIPFANFASSQLEGASFRGADLHGADLTGTNLKSTDLRGADLRRSQLGAADLSGASLEGTQFRGGTFDCYTKWPGSFDPKRAGLRQIRRRGVIYTDCP